MEGILDGWMVKGVGFVVKGSAGFRGRVGPHSGREGAFFSLGLLLRIFFHSATSTYNGNPPPT